jgi:indole-3-glycerol phosphate synthase
MATKDLELDAKTIAAAKRQRLALRRERVPDAAVTALAEMQQRPWPVLNIVTDGHCVTLIGQIRHTEIYDPVASALAYVRAGVDAVALFTDHRIYSQGMDDLLLVARGAAQSPVIAQDYVLDEYHVAEVRAAGAAALMVYSSVLSPAAVRQVASSAQRWRMTTIIQVSSADEMAHASAVSPHVIGIGLDQDFHFERDFALLEQLRPQAPRYSRVMPLGCLRSLADVEAVLALGVDAIIVDHNLLRQRALLHELLVMLGRSCASDSA